MHSDAVEEIAAAFRRARPPGSSTRERKPGRGLKCPVCETAMHEEESQGVATDVCPEHGIWLDLGEMDRILARLRGRERRAASEAVREASRDGKISGIMFGGLSLLFDDE